MPNLAQILVPTLFLWIRGTCFGMIFALVSSCTSQEKFPPIGDQVASPVDVGVSEDGQLFYVLNSDFDRTYNVGSILVLDKEGDKKGVIEVPRMGRNLVVAGTDLLVTMDKGPVGDPPRVQLYSIEKNPLIPELKAEFELECSPFGATLRKGYSHFAVSCLEGQLYIGTLANDRGQSTLKLVRNYGISRRALYIDPARELLLAFTTDPEQRSSDDIELADLTRYDALAKEVLGPNGVKEPNEVPDALETKSNSRTRRSVYTYIVYDIAQERANPPDCIVSETENCVFPFRPNFKTTVVGEQRWLYFKLRNIDGTPDQSTFGNDPNYRYYRTNIWEAKPDPDDPNIFYISHRNAPDSSPHANQIVQVSIVGDLRVGDKKEPPKTADVLQFERIYGFKGPEADKRHFPGDFEVGYVQGFKSLVVNHFRDVLNWPRKEQFFSIAAKTFADSAWSVEIEGELTKNSVVTYYQLAMNSEGRILSCSFYGNSLQLLELVPGIGFKELKSIN